MSIPKTYLIGYNLIQLVLQWVAIARIVQYNLSQSSPSSWFELADGSYQVAAPFIRLILILQWFEIGHSLVGLTRGSPLASIIQIGLKSFFFFAILEQESHLQSYPSSKLLPLLWCLGDGLRYPFYVLQLSGHSVYLVTWVRYSAWILLYPLGMLMEGVMLFNSIPFLETSGRLSYTLPNILNVSWHMTSFIYFYLIVFLPFGSYSLLSYMYRQRVKVLCTSDHTATLKGKGQKKPE